MNGIYCETILPFDENLNEIENEITAVVDAEYWGFGEFYFEDNFVDN